MRFERGSRTLCIQRRFFGVRVSQFGKPLVPNYFGTIPIYFGIVLNNLVPYQRDKALCFACDMFGSLVREANVALRILHSYWHASSCVLYARR